GNNFRPVGLACGPDGSLYCTDWVLQDYTLHQKGRVWRISAVDSSAGTTPIDIATLAGKPVADLMVLLPHARLDVRRAAARGLVATAEGTQALREALVDSKQTLRARHEALWGLLQNESTAPLTDAELDLLLKPDSGLANAVAGQMGTPKVTASAERAIRLAKSLANERLGGKVTPGSDPLALLPALAHANLVENNLVAIALSVDDPYVLGTMITLMARDLSSDRLAAILTPGSQRSPRTRVAALLAARRQTPQEEPIAALGLADPDPRVRQAAVQWVAEEKLSRLRPAVEGVFHSNGVTSELFLATLAALEMLDGANPADIDKTPAAQYVLPLVKDAKRPAGVRVQALRLVSPRDEALTTELFDSLWNADDAALRREAVRTWQTAKASDIQPRLLELAADVKTDPALRLEGVVALAGLASPGADANAARDRLARLLEDENANVIVEALRGLRAVTQVDAKTDSAVAAFADRLGKHQVATSEEEPELAAQLATLYEVWKRPVPEAVAKLLPARPKTREDWVSALGRGRGGDAEAGRRVFYHPAGPGCVKCHTVNGRGGRVGPDLSRAATTMNRLQLMQSILDPSGEIAPQFVAWSMETKAGKIITGMIVHENEGKTILGNAEGETIELKTADIVERVPQKKSVMPDKLVDRMTAKELRDLLAFLEKASQ
ncbi:MAG: c-type cytochrome, partial [Planctomycetota bacterium]|nr:c-type cytochrome [Planctomycetota bacterium]